MHLNICKHFPAKSLISIVSLLALTFIDFQPVYAADIDGPRVPTAGCSTAYYLMKDLEIDYGTATNNKLMPEKTGNKKATKLLSSGKIDFAYTCETHQTLVKEFGYPPDQVKTWVTKRIAKDPVVLVANRENPVSDLTKTQVSDIFLGKITNWKAVGGPDLEIKLTYEDNPEDASGVLGVFKENTVGKKAATVQGAARFADPRERGEYVSQNTGGLTFLGLRVYQEKFGKLLNIDGVEPTRENVILGSYPIAATYYIVYDSERKEQAEAFLKYLATEKGQAAMNRNFVSDME